MKRLCKGTLLYRLIPYWQGYHFPEIKVEVIKIVGWQTKEKKLALCHNIDGLPLHLSRGILPENHIKTSDINVSGVYTTKELAQTAALKNLERLWAKQKQELHNLESLISRIAWELKVPDPTKQKV
jgi:hypothetical protein